MVASGHYFTERSNPLKAPKRKLACKLPQQIATFMLPTKHYIYTFMIYDCKMTSRFATKSSFIQVSFGFSGRSSSNFVRVSLCFSLFSFFLQIRFPRDKGNLNNFYRSLPMLFQWKQNHFESTFEVKLEELRNILAFFKLLVNIYSWSAISRKLFVGANNFPYPNIFNPVALIGIYISIDIKVSCFCRRNGEM